MRQPHWVSQFRYGERIPPDSHLRSTSDGEEEEVVANERGQVELYGWGQSAEVEWYSWGQVWSMIKGQAWS